MLHSKFAESEDLFAITFDNIANKNGQYFEKFGVITGINLICQIHGPAVHWSYVAWWDDHVGKCGVNDIVQAGE